MKKQVCPQPVENALSPSRRADPKKLLRVHLTTIVGFSIGFWTTGSTLSFIGVPSLPFVSKALKTTNLSETDRETVGPVPVGDSVSEGRFSVSMERTLSERGLNLITAISGCHLAAWVFQGGGPHRSVIDCHLARGMGDVLGAADYHASQHLDPDAAALHIQSYDTIYVNARGLTVFVETILPNITTPIVLLVGQYYHHAVQLIPEETEVTLLNASCIVRLFAQNLGEYFHQPHHPKLAPWPYGIQPYPYGRRRHPWPSELFSETFWRLQNDKNSTKTKGIMHGYLNHDTNPKRENISSGPKLEFAEYYEEMSRHRFILSPDGDRPECYRTFEAIGLGTVPITELSASLHRHLGPAPILFETSDWDLNETQAMEWLGVAQFPTVNRMLVLEEYWLDYVEREMGGRSLRWFDRISLRKATLDDFEILT